MAGGRAARVGAEAANAAEAKDCSTIGGTVRFRHPLVRSAVYRAASAAASAGATARWPTRPIRRSIPIAAPGTERRPAGPDEDIAAELERSAGRAQRRGGLAAAAAFLERRDRADADPAHRARRALAAAQAKHQAGALDAAYSLVAIAEAGPLVELERARVEVARTDRVRGQARQRRRAAVHQGGQAA